MKPLSPYKKRPRPQPKVMYVFEVRYENYAVSCDAQYLFITASSMGKVSQLLKESSTFEEADIISITPLGEA